MDKTINHNETDYHVINQLEGERTKYTIAYRNPGHNHVVLLKVIQYKRLGTFEHELISIHLADLRKILSHMKSMNEIEGKEGQKELNHELERVVGI